MSTKDLLERLLKSLENWDKDERYMATSDLCNELQKDIKIDGHMELRICTAVLKRLDDTSNDVQSKAIQCLAILLKKVQEAQVFEICDKLCGLILEGNADLRDIYAIGLKTLVADVPEASGRGVAQRLIRRLLHGIANDTDVDIKQECLDCLSDLIRRFGHEISGEHQAITQLLLLQLKFEGKRSVHKKATTCIAAVAVVLSEAYLNELVEKLLAQIEASSEVKVLIQVVGQVSRSVGYRMGRHLDAIVPIFLKFLGDPDDESQQSESHNELRETCFQGFESFIMRCPREILPHVPAIMQAAQTFMRYDPNYVGDDDDEEEDEEDWEDEDDYEDDGLEEEDDDTSWKVRRAAVRVLTAVVMSRPEMLVAIYGQTAPEIVARFREREENVRLDIIECFTTLARTTGASSRTNPEAGVVDRLRALLPNVMSILLKQLGGKEDKTKTAAFNLLKTLCEVVPGAFTEHLSKLVPMVAGCLTDKNHALKLDALVFARLLMENNAESSMQPFVPEILPLVLDLVKEDWYKIIAEALRVVRAVIRVLRPVDDDAGQEGVEIRMLEPTTGQEQFVMPMYEAIIPRLAASDIDQEIKECAISAVGQLVASFGDHLAGELGRVMELLMARLRNDVTRVPTLKALSVISASPLDVDLSPILDGAVRELSQFLRQQSRPLKQSTLETLMALVKSSGQGMSAEHFQLVLQEAAPLISDADLHLTHLTLRLAVSVVSTGSSSLDATSTIILDKGLALATSPLLQGRALESLIVLLQALVTTNAPGCDFNVIYEKLQASVHSGMQRQSVNNIARCMAAAVAKTTPERRAQIFGELVAALTGSDETKRHLALRTVGEAGQTQDLSSVTDLQSIILQAFDSSSEETKTAAAFALGRTAAGSMGSYLPLILSSLAQDRNHYLLLSALKEVILVHAKTPALDFSPHLDQVMPLLVKHCQSSEEGVRNMVAECFGALITIHPQAIVAQLQTLGQDGTNTLMRWTIASSLRYAMSGSASTEVLMPHMEFFLSMLRDEDLGVRHATLQLCTAAVHHQPALIGPFLAPTVVPMLFETITLKAERTVDLGPFKQKVDDGLPLRKTALGCINTILETIPDQLDVGAFMDPLTKALADQADVQMLCHQVVIKVCANAMMRGAIISSLDRVVEPLRTLITKTLKSIMKKVKEGQVGTEVDRQNDLVRSCLRAFLAIESMEADEVGSSPQFKQLRDQIQASDRLRAMVGAIQAEG